MPEHPPVAASLRALVDDVASRQGLKFLDVTCTRSITIFLRRRFQNQVDARSYHCKASESLSWVQGNFGATQLVPLPSSRLKCICRLTIESLFVLSLHQVELDSRVEAGICCERGMSTLNYRK